MARLGDDMGPQPPSNTMAAVDVDVSGTGSTRWPNGITREEAERLAAQADAEREQENQ